MVEDMHALHEHHHTTRRLGCKITGRGMCKSWTLDSGLDRGLDCGLDCGLDYGLIFGLDYGLSLAWVTTISDHVYQHMRKMGTMQCQ